MSGLIQSNLNGETKRWGFDLYFSANWLVVLAYPKLRSP